MIHFTALDYSLWLLDFLLALAGLSLAFRKHRKIWALWTLLAWWSVGDLITFAAHFFSPHAYTVAYFIVNLPLLVFEFTLAVILCGVLVRERQVLVVRSAGAVAIAGGLFLAWRHHAPLYIGSVLQTEMACCGILGIMLALGWIGRLEIMHGELSEPWRGIMAGTILLVTVQALSFALQAHYQFRYWDWVARIRPVGELAALALWILMLWKSAKEEAREKAAREKQVRLELPPKIEPTSLKIYHGDPEARRWVM